MTWFELKIHKFEFELNDLNFESEMELWISFNKSFDWQMQVPNFKGKLVDYKWSCLSTAKKLGIKNDFRRFNWNAFIFQMKYSNVLNKIQNGGFLKNPKKVSHNSIILYKIGIMSSKKLFRSFGKRIKRKKFIILKLLT